MAAVYQLNKNPSAARRLIEVVGSAAAAAVATVVLAPAVALQLTEADRMEVQRLKSDKVQDIFQKAMSLARDIPTSNIGQDIWLHLWDCGGQPLFLELLPVFLTARTMFLLLFDASKDLHSNWHILQYRQGKREELGEEVMSTLDLMLQWMATTYAHLARLDDDKCLLEYPRLIPVGTHGDRLAIADWESVKKSLTNAYKSAAFSSIVMQPLLVDNTKAGRGCEEDEAFQTIRKEIHNLTLHKLAFKTPVTWVLFRKVLQKLEKKVMSMGEVCKIGAACEIPVEDVPKVLTFYHELGVLLFYGHIKSLQDQVIVDPKWLVKQLGNLLTLPGKEKAGDPSMWSLLRSKGILLESLFQEVWKNDQHLKPSTMMDLLIHFLLAAPVPCTGKHHRSASVKEFFLPAMMEMFKGNPSIVESNGSTKAASLYIIFNMGFVPPGFFTRLITTLSMYKEGRVIDPTAVGDYESVLQGDFKIMFNKKVFQNRVTFRCQKSQVDDVTLTGSAHSIQVDMIRCIPHNESYPSFHDCCCELLSALKHCSQHITEALYGNLGRFGRATTITSDFAFKCLTCPSTDVHYCTFEPSHPVSLPLCCSHGKYHRGTLEEKCWLSADSLHVCGIL